ncbi:MAG: hypothetical protein JWO36_5673 [Myxococcales bacterium]|nr:hypothetical protein [Myxococcales bacterium]
MLVSMAMWISLARVKPEAFETIKGNAEILDKVFMEEDADALQSLGIAGGDISGLDYATALEMLELDSEDDDGEDQADEAETPDDAASADPESTDGDAEQPDSVMIDLCVDGELDYVATYGPAFYLSPAAAKKAAANSKVLELDDEVKALVQTAAEHGHYVVGIVS